MTKDENIRELSDKIDELEVNYARLLKEHNLLEAMHKNFEWKYGQMETAIFGIMQAISNLNEKLESYYRSTR